MTIMLSEALDYAKRGWHVFPCREKPGAPFIRDGREIIPGEKQPYVSKGLHRATLDEDQITAWWTQWPDAMIGVNAGASGLFVVDIDKKHTNGLETFASWHINDVAGLHSFTPSGGMHIVFTGAGKSGANAKTGIDTRGEGGYFIAPPSKIIEGDYPGSYERFDDWGRTPGVIPDGLLNKLFPNGTVEYVRGNSVSYDGEKRQLSRNTLNFLANGAEQGERNSELFKVLADFAGCGYELEHARETVLPVALRIGLPNSEFETVLKNAYSKDRSPSIPDSIQQKLMRGGKNIATEITDEEQVVLEEALLACLLTENAIIPVIEDLIEFGDFQSLKNRVIYKAILRLYNRNLSADLITTANEVAKETSKITLDEISTVINQYGIDSSNALTYADIIKEKASLRRLEALLDNKQKYLAKGNLVESVASLEEDVSNIALYGGVKSTSVLDSKQATAMVVERTQMMARGEIVQLEIGFSDYDYHIGGLYSNELVILAGRAGDGKSALAMSILNNVSIKRDVATAMFSLEMSTHESICRLICQLTGLPFKNVYQGKLTKPQWKEYEKAMEMISDSKIFFDDTFGITVPELRSKIRKLVEKDIKLIVIDQLEQIRGYEHQPTYIQFDKIAYDIKNMTQEFDIPIILNHQLNRGVTDRKLKNPEPRLSDLNQAGEKPANQVWVISHDKDDSGNILQSKIKVLKNRNGPRIEFPVTFVEQRMLFANSAYSWDEDDAPQHTGHSDSGDDEPYWAKRDTN